MYMCFFEDNQPAYNFNIKLGYKVFGSHFIWGLPDVCKSRERAMIDLNMDQEFMKY